MMQRNCLDVWRTGTRIRQSSESQSLLHAADDCANLLEGSGVFMQRSWLRLLVCAFVIVAALAAAGTSAFATSSTHPCAEMTVGDGAHSGHGDHGAASRRCDSLICGAVQVLPVVFLGEAIEVRITRAPQPRDDDARLGFAGPPDLRPPIS